MRLDPLLTATPALARVSAVGSGTGGQVVLLWYSSLPKCREEQAAYELHRDTTDGDVNGRDVPRRRRACTEAGSGKGIHRQANSMVRCWRWKTWPTWRCMSSRTRLGQHQGYEAKDQTKVFAMFVLQLSNLHVDMALVKTEDLVRSRKTCNILGNAEKQRLHCPQPLFKRYMADYMVAWQEYCNDDDGVLLFLFMMMMIMTTDAFSCS
ncbi:uncharacterized protein [Triticum aestivum]|uniref:uncharacterized protein isoform X2 n=1 Tax=Triticum aestivum TaxID=4565 RepID=UPI001D007253|nr:uncharacterized protein LOC123160052 isoform X2 [Triticum aestivum]